MKAFLKGSLLVTLIIGSIYLIISCIVSIPLMDENNVKLKDINSSLKDELKKIRLTFEEHLDEFKYDSITLSRYDETIKLINGHSSSASLQNYLSLRIRNYKRAMENAGDLFIYKFNSENHDYNYNQVNGKKNLIIQQFKKNCDSSEREITNNFLGVNRNINSLYSISLGDTVPYKQTKEEFKKMSNLLFFSPLQTDFGKNSDPSISRKQGSIIFALSDMLLEKNSSSLVVILGMFGMSFLGAIISLVRKNNEPDFKVELITGKLFFIVLVSLASSLITYLSLQGGVALITLNSDTKINPYLILCICFAAAVYSEEIWLKVKNWLSKNEKEVEKETEKKKE